MRRHLRWDFPQPFSQDSLDPLLQPFDLADGPLVALGGLFSRAYAGTIDDEGEGPAEAEAEVRAVLAGRYGPIIWEASGLLGSPDAPIAAAFVCAHQIGTTDLPFLCYILVDPEHQGRGLAHHLLLQSARRLQALGHSGLHLLVTLGNTPAERLYERLGLVELARA